MILKGGYFFKRYWIDLHLGSAKNTSTKKIPKQYQKSIGFTDRATEIVEKNSGFIDRATEVVKKHIGFIDRATEIVKKQ